MTSASDSFESVTSVTRGNETYPQQPDHGLMREARRGLRPETLERVLAYIEDNLGGKLTLPAIATVAGLSVSHLKTLFRNSTGMPVYAYVLRRRVERAQRMLRETHMSISDVALASGFAHQSHLARHMNKILGCTPRAARALSTRERTDRRYGSVTDRI